MKIPKQTLTLDQYVMKVKFLIPFYILLASITFCTRKMSDDKDTTPEDRQEQLITAKQDTTAPDKISGTLELDSVSNTVYADVWLNVSSPNFVSADDFMPMQSHDSYKGIALRYYDNVNNDPDNGKDTVRLHITFNFKNELNWRVNDTVRLMSLDEENKTAFHDLKPYFDQRMDHFKNQETNLNQLLAFNTAWNTNNPSNPVVTGKDGGKKKPGSKLIPRLTKDDGILSLTLKR